MLFSEKTAIKNGGEERDCNVIVFKLLPPCDQNLEPTKTGMWRPPMICIEACLGNWPLQQLCGFLHLGANGKRKEGCLFWKDLSEVFISFHCSACFSISCTYFGWSLQRKTGSSHTSRQAFLTLWQNCAFHKCHCKCWSEENSVSTKNQTAIKQT